MPIKRNLKQHIAELRQQGKSYREIETILNCGRATIHYHCKKLGLTDTGKKRHAISEEMKKEIAKYCKKHTISEATIHFGKSKTVIFKYKDYGKKENQEKQG